MLKIHKNDSKAPQNTVKLSKSTQKNEVRVNKSKLKIITQEKAS